MTFGQLICDEAVNTPFTHLSYCLFRGHVQAVDPVCKAMRSLARQIGQTPAGNRHLDRPRRLVDHADIGAPPEIEAPTVGQAQELGGL